MSDQRIPLTNRAIQIIADNKIRAAIEAGDFDNLPGFGKPVAIFDEPYDPHWWLRRKLRRQQLAALSITQFLPPDSTVFWLNFTKTLDDCCFPVYPHILRQAAWVLLL